MSTPGAFEVVELAAIPSADATPVAKNIAAIAAQNELNALFTIPRSQELTVGVVA